ncbi:MAG: hypothetical protein LBG71_02610 [Clostridiales Family XIII bacterium]|jgi:hypothetical protein|nr:hypothetical protein [Clostridiales Family XIII bacterium]
MRNIYKKFNKKGALVTICFALALAGFFVVALGTLGSPERESKEENRMLAAFPKWGAHAYLTGEVYRGIDDFLADHVPARAFLISQADRVKSFMELQRDKKVVKVRADIGASLGADTTDASFETQEVVILPDRMLEVYKKNQRGCDDYVATMNRIASKVPEDMKVYSMLVPMRIEFEEPAYRSAADPQKDVIEGIYAAYDDKIVTVDAYSQMAEHWGEYEYFRTDHHWTALGAYYGMRAFSEVAGFTPLEITRYSETVLEGFLGYLYGMAPTPSVKAHPDALCYYMRNRRNNPATLYTYDENGNLYGRPGTVFEKYYDGTGMEPPSYAIFLGGDCAMIDIRGDGPRDRVLAVLKDSYGNAFIPWLTPYYSRIIGIDPRQFKEDLYETLEEKGVTDLLVLDYAKVTMLPSYIECLQGLAQ